MSLLDLIRAKRNEITNLGTEYGYSNFRIFGSVARGEDDEQSDIDLLADYVPPQTLSANEFIADCDERLSQLLGRKVEIVIAKNLKPHYARFILPEARKIITDIIAASGATSVKDMGKVMGAVKEKLSGQYDTAEASRLVKELLAG